MINKDILLNSSSNEKYIRLKLISGYFTEMSQGALGGSSEEYDCSYYSCPNSFHNWSESGITTQEIYNLDSGIAYIDMWDMRNYITNGNQSSYDISFGILLCQKLENYIATVECNGRLITLNKSSIWGGSQTYFSIPADFYFNGTSEMSASVSYFYNLFYDSAYNNQETDWITVTFIPTI